MTLEVSRQIFKNNFKKSVQWEPSCSTKTDIQTDRQNDIFHNLWNESKNQLICCHGVPLPT